MFEYSKFTLSSAQRTMQCPGSNLGLLYTMHVLSPLSQLYTGAEIFQAQLIIRTVLYNMINLPE